MKRIKIIAAFLAIILITGSFSTACFNNEKKVESVDLKRGTYNTVYGKGAKIEYEKIKMILKYADNSTKEIDSAKFTVNSIDTNVPGNYELKATYIDKNNKNKEHTCKKSVKVSQDEIATQNSIISFDYPETFRDYRNNITVKSVKEVEFMVRDKGYNVGIENPFKFFPLIEVRDSDGDPMDIETYACLTKVYDITETETELTNEALTNMVTITEEKGLFHFTQAAVGRKFKITLQLFEEDIRPSLLDDLKNKVLTLNNINVIEGYNVYTAEELSLFDNSENYAFHSLEDNPVRWKDYKTSHELPLIGTDREDNITALILHTNLTLTKDDFPSNFFHSDGSLKDDYNLYSRITPKDEEFTFIGNYFTVDASDLPLITKNGLTVESMLENPFSSDTNLFAFGGDRHGGYMEAQGVNNFTTINLLGNSPKTENKEYSGGVRLFHSLCEEANFDNIIARCFFTMQVPRSNETNLGKLNVSNCRNYDAFSCMFLAKDVEINIENCDLRDSGGPLFILQNTDGGAPCNLVIDSATTMEAWLNGEDAWFQINEAVEVIAPLKPITAYLNFGNKELLKTNGSSQLMDVIAVVMPTNFYETYDISGTVTLGGKTVLDINDATVKTIRNLSRSLMNVDLPIFKSSTGGLAAYVEAEIPADLFPDSQSGFIQGLFDFSGPINPNTTPEHPIFHGDYMAAFYGSLGLLARYHDVA